MCSKSKITTHGKTHTKLKNTNAMGLCLYFKQLTATIAPCSVITVVTLQAVCPNVAYLLNLCITLATVN